MFIKNVTQSDLTRALEVTNGLYEGNIIFKRLEARGKQFLVTLRVKDSKGKGAKRGYSGRRTIGACWHAFGHYFEALLSVNSKAVIGVSVSNKNIKTITKDGGNWQDWNAGSIIEPKRASSFCDCKDACEICTKADCGYCETNKRNI